jgi:SAM-dependent methyltransferase
MGTPWDRSATAYLDEWVPRFVPYHLDLVNELALDEGQRVLVTCAGAGQEVLAAARAVGDSGRVRALDPDPAMVKVCQEHVKKGAFRSVECAQGNASDVSGAPYDAIICAFGPWALEKESTRTTVLSAWRDALAPRGKVGLLGWGPLHVGGPFAAFATAFRETEPSIALPVDSIDASREAMDAMFKAAGLSLVRHTILRHTLSFPSGEAFVAALAEAAPWRKIFDGIGEVRMQKIAARFYESLDKSPSGVRGPVVCEPPVTLAIAGRPGAEVTLGTRASVRVPLSK